MGWEIGQRIDSNGRPAGVVDIAPANQTLHFGLFGSTGVGKSTMLQAAMLANSRATTGVDIIFDQKGDGFVEEYCKIRYAAKGTLDETTVIDVEEQFPVLQFFDLNPLVEDGIPRATAVRRIAKQYLTIARRVVPDFDASRRAATVIESLIRALFDPTHGHQSFGHADLHQAAERLLVDGTAPTVTDATLQQTLNRYTELPHDTDAAIADAVLERLEQVSLIPQLQAAFSQQADDGFDLRNRLDTGGAILLDLSGLDADVRHAVTLVMLTELWHALQRRKRTTTGEQPLVNVYIEEAAAFTTVDSLQELLSQGRAFDLSVALITQYPGQLFAAVDNDDIDRNDVGTELLKNGGTIITGHLPMPETLAARFAGDQLSHSEAFDIISGLNRGDWLVQLPGDWGDRHPPIYLVDSPSPPPGHSVGDYPLRESNLWENYQNARQRRHEALTSATIDLTDGGAGGASDAADTNVDLFFDERSVSAETVAFARRNLLPVTTRLPDCVAYNQQRHYLECVECATTYAPTFEGLQRTIRCCHSLQTVDRDAIPVVGCYPKLTATALQQADLSYAQGLFLQLVYAATHERPPELAFDLCRDSMIRLRENVGIDNSAVAELRERGLLTQDAQSTPHRVYSLTQAGRDLLNLSLRAGRDHGPHAGDLNESALHRLSTLAGARWLEAEFVADETHPATDVVRYHPVGDDKRLDVAALDAEGAVVVPLEAELPNNDLKTGAVADYDTMAACDTEAAIWVVPTRDAGHQVLAALNDPQDGEPRVAKTYEQTTPLHQLNIDTAGLTEMYTLSKIL